MVGVGLISKTFGSDGELIVNLFEEFPREYNTSEPLFVEIDGLAVPLFCDRFERRGNARALVVFADMDNERRASELVGHKMFMPERNGEEPDDGNQRIYLEDMEGMSVRIGRDVEGTVEQFIDGENPLLRLDIGGKEVFVPAVDEFIAGVDVKKGIVYMELPDGLLELYMD